MGICDVVDTAKIRNLLNEITILLVQLGVLDYGSFTVCCSLVFSYKTRCWMVPIGGDNVLSVRAYV